MSRSGRRSEQLALAAELRATGTSMAGIGRALRDRYGINARLAQRLARGWTQQEAAEAWSTRWPDDPKTFKNVSYWENWPGPTGHAPSLTVLDRLAHLYGCSVADLVADWGEHGPAPERASAEAAALAWQVEHLSLPELTRSVGDWAERLPARSRRPLLLKLGTAAAAAAGPDGDPSAGSVGRIGDLAGSWTSRYAFVSSGRARELTGEHHIELHATDGRLTGRSEPTPTGHLELDLRVTGMLVTGWWTERTSADGYYSGAVYHGVLQMVVDPTGRTMRGRWLGADKEFLIDSGPWTLTRGHPRRGSVSAATAP